MIAAGAPIRIVGESDFMLMVGPAAIKNATLERPERVSPAPIAVKIQELVITLSPEASRIDALVGRVKELKRSCEYAAALSLLLAEIDSQEQVSVEQKCGVAPWYYEQAAIIYRKLDDPSAEISILERFMAQRHAPGVGPGELLLRLQKSKIPIHVPGIDLARVESDKKQSRTSPPPITRLFRLLVSQHELR